MGELRIISYSSEPFQDRREAGDMLARDLEKYGGRNTVVLGIPRGGIVVARQIAGILGAEFDVVLARKLGAPGNPELAIGAVAEDGKVFLDEALADTLGVSQSYLKREKEHQLEVITERITQYRSILPKASVEGKTAIITDDGIATGATMKAALWAVRQERPERLIAAIPVAPPESLESISSEADETVCLRVPAFFAAVGQFYNSFEQIDDAVVLAILKEERRREYAK